MFKNDGEFNVYTNDPKGFQMPYECYGDLDREVKEWKYYRLTNRTKHPWTIRCNSSVYGLYTGSQVYFY
jgi:hypothetical protein